MGVFDSMKQAELQAECASRGLPAGGSNADMVARLEAHDAAELLGDEKPQAEATPAAPAPAAPPAEFDLPDRPVPTVSAVAADEGAISAGAAEKTQVEYLVAYPCPSELTTGLHESLRQMAWDQAVAHGHSPKGQLGGVHRKGWTTVNGVRHALYAVPLRKK